MVRLGSGEALAVGGDGVEAKVEALAVGGDGGKVKVEVLRRTASFVSRLQYKASVEQLIGVVASEPQDGVRPLVFSDYPESFLDGT